MSSPFDRHNIAHLSASSLNAYAAQPALWVMERLLKKSAPVGAAAHRGNAVELGVTAGLLDPAKPLEECQAAALKEFDLRTALSGDPNRTKEREAVEPTVATALAELRQYEGVPDRVQQRIEARLDDVEVPLIGFLDFAWSTYGIVLDLKTSLRLDSKIKLAHARQVSGYVHGTNQQGRVFYATPSKVGCYILENPGEHFAELNQIAIRLRRFLALSADPLELAGLLVPDTGHWLYSHPVATANRISVYGM